MMNHGIVLLYLMVFYIMQAQVNIFNSASASGFFPPLQLPSSPCSYGSHYLLSIKCNVRVPKDTCLGSLDVTLQRDEDKVRIQTKTSMLG